MPWGELPEDKNKNNEKKNESPWQDYGESKIAGDNIVNMLKNNEQKFKGFFKGTPNNGNDFDIKYIFFLIPAVFLLWLLTGFYQLDEGEQAIVLRFGKYTRTATTGLNYHLPSPVEKIYKAKVALIRKEEVGFSTDNRDSRYRSRYRSRVLKTIPDESLVLTGDENILDINYVVQWKIKNLKQFVFNVYNVEETVRSVADSALREVVGNNTLAKTYTDGRYEVEHEARQVAQNTLDKYSSGVEITTIQMMKVDPPSEVIESFREVQNAKADKERAINVGEAYRNDVLPKARGKAAKMIQEAEAYQKEVIEKARGEADRFNELYNEYKNAKNITKNRLYLNMMEKILTGTDKIIIDTNKNSGVVPYLPLPDLKNKLSQGK